MNLCVMSRNESADSTAIAAKTFGLREATRRRRRKTGHRGRESIPEVFTLLDEMFAGPIEKQRRLVLIRHREVEDHLAPCVGGVLDCLHLRAPVGDYKLLARADPFEVPSRKIGERRAEFVEQAEAADELRE